MALDGQEEFNEDFFEETLERMVVQKTGSIDFRLKDGTVRTHEALKLRGSRHENTSTEEFAGAEFEKQVQELMAPEDGSLACHFYGGMVRKWQRT